MARPKWVPKTDAQRVAIAEAVAAAKKADAAERVVWDAVQVARELDVPARFLADAVGRARATLYRHTQLPGDNQPAAESDEPAGE